MLRTIDQRWWWAIVLAACAAGCALRVAAAGSGALWTDEAWSVVYAAEARDAAGVFLRINHDNNHHLYSLWLQLAGSNPPPLLARLPAVIAGTLGILVAAVFAARRSPVAGLVAAVLFALSPALVTFGSEARGYAPMLLATLVLLLLADDALAGRSRRGAPWLIALAALLGMLCHLTMAAPVALATLWIYFDRRAALGPTPAMRETLRLMGPALLATAATVAFVFAAAAASPAGMRLGGYISFIWRDYLTALDDLAAGVAGITAPLRWIGPLVIALVAIGILLRPPPTVGRRARLYAILILTVPVAAMLLRPGNAGFARYYLASALGLLFLISDKLADQLQGSRKSRAIAAGALALIVVADLARDWQLVALGRGRPEAIVDALNVRSPGAATLALAQTRMEAMVELAAGRRDYRLRIAHKCESAPFLLSGHGRYGARLAVLQRCGVAYRRIAAGKTIPLSGDAWSLYEATRLQSSEAPVSGRASPAAAMSPRPAERA